MGEKLEGTRWGERRTKDCGTKKRIRGRRGEPEEVGNWQ
jgi:hypothetical protein